MNKFYKINLAIISIILLGFLVIIGHYLYIGRPIIWSRNIYLLGADSWSKRWFDLCLLLEFSLFVLLCKVSKDGFVFIYVYLRKWLIDFNSRS